MIADENESLRPRVFTQGFPAATREQWEALVRAQEQDPTGPLTTALGDGVEVSWLYGPDDAPVPDPAGRPGAAPFVRGTRVGTPWAIRQQNAARSRDRANAEILEDLEGGATEVLLTTSRDGRLGVPVADADELSEVLAGVLLDVAPIALDAGPDAAQVASLLLELWRRGVVPPAETRGSLRIDPIGAEAASGLTDPALIRAGAVTAAATVAEVRAEFPHVRVLAVDTTAYVEAGAGATLELAVAIVTGIEYLRAAEGRGVGPGELAAALEFTLVVGPDQFLEIAKLRAFRRLWATVLRHCGVAPAGRHSALYAVTSRRMASTLDPWTNVLRATTAAFAAGVGGADGITVLPFDQPSVDDGARAEATLGRRLARNTQLVLIEEAGLHRVADPGGGAWYVESLTDTLARRAWELVQQLERSGGIAAGIASGEIAERVREARRSEQDQLARRHHLMTGVNAFPFLDDDRVVPSAAAAEPPPPGALTPVRQAAQFEALRARAVAMEAASGRRPAVLLACVGPLASHAEQAAWATGCFEAGGILTVAGDVQSDDRGWAALLGEHELSVAVLCSGPDVESDRRAEAVAALRRAGAGAIYVAAATPEAAAALGADAGVREGDDMIALLGGLLDRLDGFDGRRS